MTTRPETCSLSIYASEATSPVTRTRSARCARRARHRARLEASSPERPPLLLERTRRVVATLRIYREGKDSIQSPPLVALVRALRAEVEALEAWSASRPSRDQREGAAIRQALDFLRAFGRMTALDFSPIPAEEREELVTLLALEHRWCYAAAGTTREIFKRVIGRTGAR